MSRQKSPAQQQREQIKSVDEKLGDFLQDQGFDKSADLNLPSLSPEEYRLIREKLNSEEKTRSQESPLPIGSRTLDLTREEEDILIEYRRKFNENRNQQSNSRIFTDEDLIHALVFTIIKKSKDPHDVHSLEEIRQFFEKI
ncbi:hypothetical protein HOF92_02845 [bacterium]|jgi:hypothetical protein|nr:hypothetical protein [bacterium]